MNNNAACHLYATVLNCTVTCNLQPIVGHFVTMTEKRLSGVWNPLITSVSHRSCQPLQIITGIKSPLSSSHPSPFPQRCLFSAKRPSLSLTILRYPASIPLPSLSFSCSVFTSGGSGMVYVGMTLWYKSFPSRSLLLSLFCLSLPPPSPLLATNQSSPRRPLGFIRGHLNISDTVWKSHKLVVVIVRKLPVTPTHRQGRCKALK